MLHHTTDPAERAADIADRMELDRTRGMEVIYARTNPFWMQREADTRKHLLLELAGEQADV